MSQPPRTIQRLVQAAGGFDNAHEGTLAGFMTHHGIDSALMTMTARNSFSARYTALRTDATRNAPHTAVTVGALNTRLNNLVRAGLNMNAVFRQNAWEVDDRVQENNRYELTLRWNGHQAGNKTIHCSFRHVLLSYLEGRFHGNLLNTIAYCSPADFKRGMLHFAEHIKTVLDAAADLRTLTMGAVNTYNSGNYLRFQADNGFAAGAAEIHCFCVETAGKAKTIGAGEFADFSTVVLAYRTYTTDGRRAAMETDEVKNAWAVIRDNAAVTEILTGGGLWHELDRLIPEPENMFGMARLLA